MPLTLEEYVRDYYWRRNHPASQIKRDRDNIPEFAASQTTLTAAIRVAVRSRRPNGNIHNHQSRVTPYLPDYEKRLLRRLLVIAGASSFHALWQLCEREAAQVHMIGPTTAYDVATRIGAFLNLHPDRLYFHAGVEDGLRALGVPNLKGRTCLDYHELPYPLNHIDVYDVEDFVCAYRQELYPGLKRFEPDMYARWFFKMVKPIWHEPKECWVHDHPHHRGRLERTAWRVWYYPLPVPTIIEHKCKNPLCINMHHLAGVYR